MTAQNDKTIPIVCCRRTAVNGHLELIFEVANGAALASPRIVLQDSPPSVLLEDGNGNSITLNATGITIKAASRVTVNASVVEVSAGSATVNSPSVNFSGVVQAETVIAQQVFGPGGNIW
jgi:hypothetical protein